MKLGKPTQIGTRKYKFLYKGCEFENINYGTARRKMGGSDGQIVRLWSKKEKKYKNAKYLLTK